MRPDCSRKLFCQESIAIPTNLKTLDNLPAVMMIATMFGFKVKTKVALINREPVKLTLDEWRADEMMSGAASKVLNDATMKLMLQVLYNSSPAWEVLTLATPDDRIAQQCKIEGYTMALANLEALGKHQEMSLPLEATWEPEEQISIQRR